MENIEGEKNSCKDKNIFIVKEKGDLRYCHGVGWILAEVKHKRKHEEVP
jgi:hypothetical protein